MYTRVIVNVTKRMKEAPILLCMFLHQYLILKEINYPTTPITHSNAQWDHLKKLYVVVETCTTVWSLFFCLVPTQKTIYHFVDFFLCLDIHLNKMGGELLYYHFYHEEAPFSSTYVLNCLIFLFLFF